MTSTSEELEHLNFTTNVRLSRSVRRRLEARAAMNGESISDFVRRAVENELNR